MPRKDNTPAVSPSPAIPRMASLKTCVVGLAKMFRPIGGKVFISMLTGIVGIAVSLLFVVESKTLIDIVTHHSDAPLKAHIIYMAVVMAAQIGLFIFDSWWMQYVIENAKNRIRLDIFGKVMHSSWNGKEQFLSGDTVNRLEEDTRVVAELLCERVPGVVVTVFQLLAASVYLMTLAPNLLWVLIALMVVGIVGSRMYYRKFRVLTAAIRKGESDIQQHMQESLQHRVLVLTLGALGRVLRKMGLLQDELIGNVRKRLNYNAVSRTFMGLGFRAGYAAAFFWGIFGIKAGTVTYGMMTAFLQLVGQVQRPIADLSRQVPAFIHALTSAERLLELEALPQEEKGEQIMVGPAPGIEVKDVSFSYEGQDKMVLDSFSATFEGGTFSAIAGPTGIGKSTLVRLILGLLTPTGGSITIDGVPVGSRTRGNFMFVPQGNSLLSGTIRDNLLLADPDATDDKLLEVLDVAQAHFIKELPEGLDTVCGETGSGLSEGQAQRIAIARALLGKGGVLILDESTSALDARTESDLLDSLKKYCHASKTIIFVSHREAVLQVADSLKVVKG